MTPAVAYLRVSGLGQLTGTGLDRQLLACQTFAVVHGLNLADSFREEAVSGTVDEDARPAFQAMIAAMLDRSITVLLIERLDRLARMLDVQMQLVTYIAAKGLTLLSADTGEDITAAVLGDPMRRAMVQMQGVFAELDKSMIVAKLRKGRERTKARLGRCEGSKPFGFYPGESAILGEIRSLRASGMYYHDIAVSLNRRSLPTRHGRRWHGAVISRILGNMPCDTKLVTDCAIHDPVPRVSSA